jgi:hypothetical protein
MAMQDLEEALLRKQAPLGLDANAFVGNLSSGSQEHPQAYSVAGFADIAGQVSSKDWSGFMTDRISSWAASYFDRGQAQWKAADTKSGIYAAWRFEAENDRTPEVMGLRGFRHAIKGLPSNALIATHTALKALGINENVLDLYLHRLLLRHGGWSAYIAQLDWEQRIYGHEAGGLHSFLCALICWEYGLQCVLKQPAIDAAWAAAKSSIQDLASTPDTDGDLWNHLVLQDAYDIAAQRSLIHKFDARVKSIKAPSKPPEIQAVFCIDVRSELYRRNLEMVSPEVETLGFAGFFGFPIKYLPLGHEKTDDHCPVLLPANYTVVEGLKDTTQYKTALDNRKSSRLFSHALKSFRSGAISGFGFVSPLGLSYLPKLFTDSFGLTRPVANPDKMGLSDDQYQQREVELEVGLKNGQSVGIPLDTRVEMAKGALTAMSLTDGFAQLVLIVGHGATSVNNPHASGLDCGACAGRSGETNARVAAGVLNDPEVRAGLRDAEIHIPESTLFIAGLHDTTTDVVTLYNPKTIPVLHHSALARLEVTLKKAGIAARSERSLRMRLDGNADIGLAIESRSKDWSQVRPEWGLAGCSAFVVAPRSLTKGINLEGRSFLHSYEWKKDTELKVLEIIMTAPMVVTSWINLQYYGSTVDNTHYGSGNKTLHNVTAGIGVLEGYAGDLRAGLPMQSVHDGSNYQHEPLRLSVVINAPKEAINTILEKHPSIQELFDNRWIFLFTLDDHGKVSFQYRKNLQWERTDGSLDPKNPIRNDEVYDSFQAVS